MGAMQDSLDLAGTNSFKEFRVEKELLQGRDLEWPLLLNIRFYLETQTQKYSLSSLLTELQAQDLSEIELDFNEYLQERDLLIPPSFEMKDLTFKYESTGDNILSNFNQQFEAGKTYGILGSSGSGKSTVFNLIAGLLLPSEGKVLIDGKDALETDYSKLLDRTSYVTQNSQVFMTSILENMLLGNTPLTSFLEEQLKIRKSPEEQQKLIQFLAKEILLALEKSRSISFVQDCPQGIQTVLGDRVRKVSNCRESVYQADSFRDSFLQECSLKDQPWCSQMSQPAPQIPRRSEKLFQNWRLSWKEGLVL